MTDIKQADPDSLLLPIREYATEPPERTTCHWINTKGVDVGKLCGRVSSMDSKYCAAHAMMGKRYENALDDNAKETVKHFKPEVKWVDSLYSQVIEAGDESDIDEDLLDERVYKNLPKEVPPLPVLERSSRYVPNYKREELEIVRDVIGLIKTVFLK